MSQNFVADVAVTLYAATGPSRTPSNAKFLVVSEGAEEEDDDELTGERTAS